MSSVCVCVCVCVSPEEQKNQPDLQIAAFEGLLSQIFSVSIPRSIPIPPPPHRQTLNNSIPGLTRPLGSSWVRPTETLTGATVQWQQAFPYTAPRPTESLCLWALSSCSSLQVLRHTPYPCTSVRVLSHFCHVQFFATLWTVTHQAPLSIGFSRQEYWSCHALLQGIFPTQGPNWHL